MLINVEVSSISIPVEIDAVDVAIEVTHITGSSAYQSYLATTTDVPPLSEGQWANQMGNAEAALDAILLILNLL